MYEVLPIVGGLAVGAAAARYASGRARLMWLALGSVAVGAFAALVSGELAESAGFLIVDILLAGAAAAAAAFLPALLTGASRRGET